MISYECYFDNLGDTTVASTSDCSTLPGTVSFDTATGVLDWTPSYDTNGVSATWEIRITGTAITLTSDAIFVGTLIVTIDLNII